MTRHEEIQKTAYQIFEKSGRTHGRDLEHWLEAERIVSARQREVHAVSVEAAASRKRPVERADTRRREPKKAGRAKAAR